MIERKFVADRIKEYQIQEYISENLKKVGHSHTKLVKTPLGEKIVIFASRPGLIVGRKGENIKKLTKTLKKQFNLENPQIEISEVDNQNLDAQIVAEKIANSLERFGTSKFKGVGHKMMTDVLSSGALGVEIIISGKIPSARAKSWRFYQGYLKKCGDAAIMGVKVAHTQAQLKTGIVGIKVSIMPPDIVLPDRITFKEDIKEAPKAEEKKEEANEEKKETKKEKESKTEKKEESKETKEKKKKASE